MRFQQEARSGRRLCEVRFGKSDDCVRMLVIPSVILGIRVFKIGFLRKVSARDQDLRIPKD